MRSAMDDQMSYAVAGKPVLHSLSAYLFNAAFDAGGVHAVYTRIAVPSAGAALSLFNGAGFSGMNVTAPFKVDMARAVDLLDGDAASIGAVNTVIREGSATKGYNTDHIGVTESFARSGVDVKNKQCVVLGAGGAARAAAYALTRSGGHVTIVNRTADKAAGAARACGCKASRAHLLKLLLKHADILVSTLPPQVSLLEDVWLKRTMTVLEANYVNSSIAEAAKRRGCRVIGGGEWLINQAVPAYRRFIGANPDEDAMRSAFEASTRRGKKHLVTLIGFMGCGKSAIGLLLADQLGYPFYDTDDLIRQDEQMTIPEIFKLKGEEYFRQKEKAVLRRLLGCRRGVLSCGGGVILDKENSDLLKERSIVVWIWANADTCLHRIQGGARPLLDCSDAAREAMRLYNSRAPLYVKTSDLVVSGEAVPETVSRVICDEIRGTI